MDAAALREKEDALLAQWRARRQPFVGDGLVDAAQYVASSPRIAFALKEVNDPHAKEAWDLRRYLWNGGRASTWNDVVRWTSGMRSAEPPLWRGYEHVSEGWRREVLRSIAVINMKKSPGAGSSDWSTIAAVAAEDRDLLGKQLDLYRPDVLVCCGVDGAWFPQLAGVPWHRTTRGVFYARFGENQVAIRYCHPQARWPGNLKLYGLIDALDEVQGTRPAEP